MGGGGARYTISFVERKREWLELTVLGKIDVFKIARTKTKRNLHGKKSVCKKYIFFKKFDLYWLLKGKFRYEYIWDFIDVNTYAFLNVQEKNKFKL